MGCRLKPPPPRKAGTDQHVAPTTRPLLSDTRGAGGSNWSPGILADPPTHPHQKIFPQEKNEIYQRGPNLEVDFRYTNFFLASDPPPPRYSINQPLSKGLPTTTARSYVPNQSNDYLCTGAAEDPEDTLDGVAVVVCERVVLHDAEVDIVVLDYHEVLLLAVAPHVWRRLPLSIHVARPFQPPQDVLNGAGEAQEPMPPAVRM